MRIRHAVRGLILSPDDELLMMRFIAPGRAVWITLGGGLERGETPVAGLRRELCEETERDGWQIGPEVWRRAACFELDGEMVEQRERYFLVRSPWFEPPGEMPDERERRFFGGFAWWTAPEIAGSAERFAPRRLATCLQRLLAEGPPSEPIDVGR